MAKNRGPEFDKHIAEDEIFYKYLGELDQLFEGPRDLIFQFPAYVGYVNLARFLMLYDLYRQVHDLNGHVADVGTFKGASFLFFAKLIKLFEPYSTTVVHGFDWFQGMAPEAGDAQTYKGGYVGDYERLLRLTEVQGLSEIAHLHKLDLTKELPNFFADKDYTRFKIVFIDCGIRQVLEESVKAFWPRLVNGGIMVFDHFNAAVSPFENLAVEPYLDGRLVRTMPYCRQPTGYVVK